MGEIDKLEDESIQKVGVLLVNLGTPAAPTSKAVKRYLAEFLSDRRVVEIPRLLWAPILRGVILPLRSRRSARAYRKVWTAEGSPLATITSSQARMLQERLAAHVAVRWAMRYGEPSLAHELDRLQADGCDRILVAPLYPQYSAATTASTVDSVSSWLARKRRQPTLRFLPPYFGENEYLEAIVDDIDDQIAALEFDPEVLILSFHGLPQRSVELGDPYRAQCVETAASIERGLLARRQDFCVSVSFQSRFGPAQWLQPYTDEVLSELARSGVKRVAIAAPGFSADCLETLEEIAIEGRETFHAAGGQDFAYLRCLNAERRGVEMLEKLVRRELLGWLGQPTNSHPALRGSA
ncbi:ferrochelatase [Novosphingobium sp. JCM 18896]|uniref:ferrochelatase n=1 Tax=Novosphingobium sp. JCM 18896 TaxID=2989731 RepID=UPI002221F1EF|nr:ferrochelatase [Novosphingobium sp. JCM 18896]MCW1432488.1 ferrochelatase [Novosphingobium sp. JCM 18896]